MRTHSLRHTKIRVETDPERLLKFLGEHDYPCPWSLESLRDYCVILRVDRGGATLAYVWASWVALGVLEFHACAASRNWLTSEMLGRLYMIAELFGAHTIQATPRGAQEPTLRRFLHNRGFKREGGTMFKRLEHTDGPFQRAEDRTTDDPPCAPGDAGTAGSGDDPGGL